MKTRSSEILKSLGVALPESGALKSISPINGQLLGSIDEISAGDTDAAIAKAQSAFLQWRKTPAPVRGELVRLFGEELRRSKIALGELVTLEAGKILSEGLGEVQEMIDICDYAVGLSRQLYGLTIASERPGHHMREMWHPLGPVGIISAFNFPVAVWCWNAALALVCGNSCLWKPSEKTPLVALAVQSLFERAVAAFKANGHNAPENLSQVLIGGREIGEQLAKDARVPLISATGSTAMGRKVAVTVAERLGKTLLELGGNNAMIVTPDADLEMTVRAILFAAVGTAGQRCTSLRRLIVHEDVAQKLLDLLVPAYKSLRIGNPLEKAKLVGPLIDQGAFDAFEKAIETARSDGGEILTGGKRAETEFPDAYYAEPAIIRMASGKAGQTDIVKHETFAPILYVIAYRDFAEAIAMQNDVAQGLSSCVFTNNIREAEFFLSGEGSDCGIANVNIGPSGAEIGGAFGGEKDTGGGRESGSDSWRNYMRRQTQTVNYSSQLPLAQGVKFTV